ncbi:hypothetical protein [Nonomuraea endophytica]|uniref:Transmembrane protein n=1 Tax=Nonomuraea endophytica TaxID=714136 RepID=A0A7W8A4B5_9ACTN|nr:hypothetical protein [Nonomuraea endophytica]MBB5079274.1 hypothetical protein [Nonomuraea endophytica]
MVTTASVLTPAVVVVAAVVTLVNVQEFKRRWLSAHLAREITRPVYRTYSPGLVALLGALGAGVAFLLSPPLARLGHAGTAGIVLIAAAGLALGVAGLSFLGLGAAVHALLWPPDPLVVYWWAAPLVAGGILRFLHLAEHDRRGAWGLVAAVNRNGPVIMGTAPAEPFWRAAGLLAGLAPLAAVVAAGQGFSPADRAALAAAAVLVAGQTAWTDLRSRAVPERLARLGRLAGAALLRAGTVVLAAGPVGAACADLWSRGPTGVSGGLLLAAWATLPWLLLDLAFRLGRSVPAPARVLATLIRVPLTGGFAAVALAVFHPRPGFAVAALLLAAAETATLAAGRGRAAPLYISYRSATGFLTGNPDRARNLAGKWLRDAILNRPARPDFNLIRALGKRAALAARGDSTGDPAHRTGLDALCWADLADRLLDLVDSEVRPRYPGRHRARLDLAAGNARADVSWSRAIVLTHAAAWDEACRQWGDCATRRMLLGHPAHELFARAMITILLVRLGRTADAARAFDRLGRAATPVPVLRACVALAGAALTGGPALPVPPVTARALRSAWWGEPGGRLRSYWTADESALILRAVTAADVAR